MDGTRAFHPGAQNAPDHSVTARSLPGWGAEFLMKLPFSIAEFLDTFGRLHPGRIQASQARSGFWLRASVRYALSHSKSW